MIEVNNIMKRIILVLVVIFFTFGLSAQNVQKTDSVFCTYLYNEEYQVYLDIDFYNKRMQVPGQEFLGDMPGYFGASRDSRKWLITSAVLISTNKADIDFVNDYGSEDLTATLQYNHKDKTYVLKQKSGSRLKIVVNRKWVKIPNELLFVPHKRVADKW